MEETGTQAAPARAFKPVRFYPIISQTKETMIPA